jgi:octaprenyl-diphosphate synthase
VIYALNQNPQYESMMNLARKVKAGTINTDEIAVLVEFTKQHGGIDYAEKRMEDFHREALKYLEESVKDDAIRVSLSAYLDYVIQRKK